MFTRHRLSRFVPGEMKFTAGGMSRYGPRRVAGGGGGTPSLAGVVCGSGGGEGEGRAERCAEGGVGGAGKWPHERVRGRGVARVWRATSGLADAGDSGETRTPRVAVALEGPSFPCLMVSPVWEEWEESPGSWHASACRSSAAIG